MGNISCLTDLTQGTNELLSALNPITGYILNQASWQGLQDHP